MYILFDIFFPDEIDIEKSLVESAKSQNFDDSVNTCINRKSTSVANSLHNKDAATKLYHFEDLEDVKTSNIYSKFLTKKNNNECIIM